MRLSLFLAFLAGCGGLTSYRPGETDGRDLDGTDGPGDTSSDPIDSANHDGNNTAPVADAGPDQEVEVSDVVQLDGAASNDPDGDEITYLWEFTSQPADSASTLVDERRPDAQFWADAEGTYVVRLTVDDGRLSSTDDVEILVTTPNGAPTADAGLDQTVAVGDTVQLNGSGSTDPDGDTLTFSWTLTKKPSGSAAALDDPTNPLPRFTADAAGEYQVQLIVNDGEHDSSADTVRIQAESADDSDCLSCAAQAEQEMKRRLRAGDLMSGPGLVLLPLFVMLWQRRRRD